MNIENVIFHEVLKLKAGKASDINTREDENKIDNHAIKLLGELSALFRKTGLSSGSFSDIENEDDPRPTFLTLLDKYFIEKKFTDFVKFSQGATRDFKRKLDESAASKGGNLLFNHYTSNGDSFLYVVLLRKRDSFALSKKLNLDAIETIDLSTLHMACRINLSAWKDARSDRYIAFKFGKGANDVTDYFGKFIGCEEYKQSKEDTMSLIKVLSDYCVHHKFSEIETEESKKFVFDQCKEWKKSDTPALVENISEMLDKRYNKEDEKAGFLLETAQNEPYLLSNEIQINSAALRGLIRYSGNSKGISISFDSKILGDTVIYDPNAKTLSIKAIPPQLLAQLEEQ